MKNFYWIIIFSLLVSCGKKESQQVSPALKVQQEFQLRHKRVKELFVVLFEKNYTASEWKDIFDLTRVLSANKKTLRSIEGDDSEAAGAIRSPLIKENAEILSVLGAKSIFMMSWSSQDENCKILQKDSIQLTCKPRNVNNPLNGGLPSVVAPLEWINPDPIRSEVKIPYLKIMLKKDASPDQPQHYSLELRLKEEQVSDAETWFKGEAIPASDSQFMTSEGKLVDRFFKFGYAEMTVGN